MSPRNIVSLPLRASFEERRSLVRIKTRSQREVAGTGFMISKNQILTCWHVVRSLIIGASKEERQASTQNIYVDFPLSSEEDRDGLLCSLDKHDSEKDIAILTIDQIPSDVGFEKLVILKRFWKHSFRSQGYSKISEGGVWTRGVLTGAVEGGRIQVEDVKVPGAPIDSGFSGAPVWNEKIHALVGMIVTASEDSVLKIGHMIPTSIIMKVVSIQAKEVLEFDLSFTIKLLQRTTVTYIDCHNSISLLKEIRNELTNKIDDHFYFKTSVSKLISNIKKFGEKVSKRNHDTEREQLLENITKNLSELDSHLNGNI
jgi:hypothetical protein